MDKYPELRKEKLGQALAGFKKRHDDFRRFVLDNTTEDILKDFDDYMMTVNEGVRDQMTPKSEKEIKKLLKNLPPNDRLCKGCEEGLLWLVKDALDNGADIHYNNDWALEWAIDDDNIEIVKVLLEHGANPNANNGYPYEMAVAKGHRDIALLLLQYMKTDESVRDKMTPKPKTDIEQELSKLPIKDRITYMSNNNLFDTYTDDDFLSYFKTLNQDELDSFLTYCVLSKRMNAISILLKCGANPNSIGPFNVTPLYHAVVGTITSHPDINVIKLLLNGGADPTFPNKIGLTPLNHTITFGKWDLCELLRKYVK